MGSERLGPAGFALALTIATLGSGLMMYRGYCHLVATGVFPPVVRREEKRALSYESKEVEQLVESTLYRRAVPLDARERELYRMDKDRDCKITEKEVMFYVRNK